MKSLDQIKLLFENRNYSLRSEFINEYDFNDSYFDYYHQFILKSKNVNDHLYLSDLIDLSGWLNIYDKELRDRWFSYLFMPKHYIVKLAVLDYFKFCNKKLLDESFERKLNLMLQKKLISILRVQILFNLIILNSRKNILYTENLVTVLERTKDWKSVHRTLNNIREVRISPKSKTLICNSIKNLRTQMELGKDTLKLIEEVC